MELEVNERGNLFVPSSRLVPMLQSTFITAAVFFVSNWFNGVDFEEHFPSPAIVIGTLVLGVVTVHLLLSIQSDVEFDNSSQQVVKGRKVITPYHLIRQVELQRGQGDEPGFTIRLRLGASRSIRVLTSNDETGASLDAAEIARAVGKPVVLVD